MRLNLHPKVKWSALAALLVAVAAFLGLPLSEGQASGLTAVLAALVGYFVPSPSAPVSEAGAQDNDAAVEEAK